MKYKNYTALDFANDAFFIRWVKHPDEESDFFWNTFMRESPACSAAIKEARQLILSFNYQKRSLPAEALTEMRNNLWMHMLVERQGEERPKQRYGWWLAAASIAVLTLVMAGFVALYHFDDAARPYPTSVHKSDNEIITHKGQNSMILLADGSRVWLNDSSILTYSRDFTSPKTRDVYLEGEAFFQVAKDASHPFIVHTSDIKIKVLGTAFSVKSYPTDKTVETTLVSGKVRIEQSDERGKRVGDIELKPNQKAVFHKESRVIKVRDVKASAKSAWKRNRLVFDEEPVRNILHQLEMWYGVDIDVTSEKLDCRLTGTIEKESLEQMLELLKMTHGIAYRIDGKRVFITGNFCL